MQNGTAMFLQGQHWLSERCQAQFKLVTLVNIALNDLGPQYIFLYQPPQALRLVGEALFLQNSLLLEAWVAPTLVGFLYVWIHLFTQTISRN